MRWTGWFSGSLCVLALCVVGGAVPAPADEITVKNDSIVDGGQAVIVGDFAVGEQAGARLTMPQNGTLVAVQVLWLEGTPGHPPSLQNAIYIYDGTTFPTPGAALATLEGPVLTPGYWNEWRYLDEAQTIPIDIPVVAGQKVTIALEFGEPTDVGNGGPSVVRDVNGCQSGKNALYAIPPGAWYNFCIYLVGDLAIRAVLEIPDPTGACCFINGGCGVYSQAECTQLGGTYQGNNTDCDPNPCPLPSGACCIPSTQGCIDLNQTNCAIVGGIWAGAGTSCSTYICFPRGACCLPDGTCQDDRSPEQCSAAGGTFQGHQSQCANISCPQPQGACCLPNGNCIVFSQSDCAIVGGTWKGLDTDCADNNSNGTADACEQETICRGDCNCDGVIDFDDINPFVDALSGGTPCSVENCDVNDDGVIDFNDINPLVDALSSGAVCP